MELINNLYLGFGSAFSMINIWYCFLGILVGTTVGVLPGIGPIAAIAMLLPITYSMGPAPALIFLSAVYYGAQYGGSTSAILLKIPGEASSLITVLDGNAMALKGRAGAAIAIAAISSFVAGTVITLFIAALAKPIAEIAFLFGPAEYALLMAIGLLLATVITNESMLSSIGMVLLGLLLSTVGTDINTGVQRFTFGILELYDGIAFVVLAVGMIGLGEILYNTFHELDLKLYKKYRNQYPNKKEIKQSIGPTLRGTIVGGGLGLLPGVGAVMASFMSYVLERKISRQPDSFGKGQPAGVAGPEAANNAAAQSNFIPMLSLGIPATPVMALILSALMVQNVVVGPSMLSSYPEIFWGLIASMWMGNIMLLIVNLPLIPMWIKLLQVPRWILYPLVAFACILGTYYSNFLWTDVWLLLPFAIMGYSFKLLGCNPAPMALGFVIGPLFEDNLRKALLIHRGDWGVFFGSTTTLVIWTVTFALLALWLAMYFYGSKIRGQAK